MKEKKPINENDLDKLLRLLSLQENSDKINEREAEFILSGDYHVEPDPKKKDKLIRRLSRSSGSGGLLFLALALITILLVLMWVPYQKEKEKNTDKEETSTGKATVAESSKEIILLTEKVGDAKTQPLLKTSDTFGRPKKMVFLSNADSGSIHKAAIKNPDPLNAVKNQIPILAEKDKARYLKVKDEMLARLLKFDKGLYTHVYASKIPYAGKAEVVEAFSIRNVGITNLEYKTFLADLLMKKKHQEFLLAQVHSENWLHYNCPVLANTYFEDEKYSDYPVVNITSEGARLFCKWLEDEAELYMEQHKIKPFPLEIRLPLDIEWIHAAREGFARVAFGRGYNTFYDATEGIVDENFYNRVQLVIKRIKRKDSLYAYSATNRFGWNEKEILNYLDKGLHAFTLTHSDTINVERMKVLGKIGRVSEFVDEKKSQRVWLGGLSWKNREEYLLLENEMKTNLSSPFIGFRPVIINGNDPVYKNPFW